MHFEGGVDPQLPPTFVWTAFVVANWACVVGNIHNPKNSNFD